MTQIDQTSDRGTAAPRERVFRRTAGVDSADGLAALGRLNRMILRYPRRVAVALGCTLGVVAAQLSIPVLLGRAVDETEALASGAATDRGTLISIALTLLAVSAARGLFTLAQNYSAESVGHALAHDLRLAVYDKVQRLPFSFHDRTHSGDLITVGMLDLEGMRMYFSTALVRTMLLALLIGIGAWLLLSTDVVLGLLALSFVPFAAWRSSVMQLTLRRTWLILQERLGVLSQVMEENLAGIRVVRAFAAAPHEMAKFDAASADALELSHERVNVRVRNTSPMTLAFFAAMGLVLLVGGRQVAAGEITVGTLATFLTFMTLLQMPVRQLGLMVNAYARGSTCGARLFRLLDIPVEIDDVAGAPDLAVTDGTLRFEDVSFAYPGAGDHRAIAGVSFTARRGETIGIVGAAGAGKSTLLHLIPRFYDVDAGRISIDGQDIREVSLSSLRRAVAVVQQDSFLFTTTIENNIAYADPFAGEGQIEEVSQSAQLHDYVAGLPHGYRTVVGERGVSLSGGQRQRLSIARTLMTEPAVLIFDDSTAAIDAGTESRIRRSLRDYAADRVTIIVAHRLGSLKHADRILFLEYGRVVEEGSHDELLALGGRYRALHDLQLRPEADMLDRMQGAAE